MKMPGCVATIDDHADIPPLHHSVYVGRQRLGCYVRREGIKVYSAYDAEDGLVGNFKTQRAAYQAVTDAARAPGADRGAA